MRHNAIIVRPTLTVNVPDTLLVPPLGIAAACVAPGQRPTVGELTGTAVILIGLARSRRIFSSDGR